MRSSTLALVLAVLATPVAAQVPTFEQVSGHAFGARITVHQEMAAYLARLAETSDRVTVVDQGTSWEGRRLLLAIVTHPDNHARLDDIRQASLALHAGREAPPGQPVVVWFGGSIHGNELSGSEGVLKLLEHLATRDDAATIEALRTTVVLIDPMLNPDGRDAFAGYNHQHIGRVPNPSPDDWNNDVSGWNGTSFRTGHYNFDNNRDWFAQTQPETRHRVAFLRTWAPQVAIDMHEMGASAEFYFDPPGDPVNPYFPAFASRWFRTFGDAYAQAFDSAGFEYMSRERYNYFYAGYTSNRGYQGAVAMLFEQGSTRGLAHERGDGSVRTLADALEQQYLAAWTAVRTAAARRADLLREYAASQRDAVAGGHGGVRRYFVAAGEGDPLLVRELVTLLRRNGITVGQLTQAARVGGRSFAAGDWVVDLAQPSGRVAGTLLAPDTPLPEAFLRRARAFVDRDENPRFYDITSWSLGLLFNLGVYGSDDARAVSADTGAAVDGGMAEGQEGRRAGYAYLLDGRNAATPAALTALLDSGYRAAVLLQPTRLGGVAVPGGAGIVRVGQNDSTLHGAVRTIAGRFGVAVTPVDAGLADSGLPSLGSGDHTFNLRRPAVGLLAGPGSQGYSFGWNWYTLDRQYEIPLTILRASSLDDIRLERFTSLLVPDLSATVLRGALGEDGTARLTQWVEDGGTLVVLGAATDWAREVFSLALRDWYDTDDGKHQRRFTVPGAVMQVHLDTLHWMTAGYRHHMLPVHVNSSRLYLPPDGPVSNRRRVIAAYTASPLLSGHAWDESLARLPDMVYAYEERVGSGRVVVFAEEVSFRAFARGTNRLLLNALVLGPTAP